MNLQGFFPATILSYDAVGRTAQIRVPGLTDGASDGLTATLAYPIGDDDKDTERLLVAGAEVFVFFEQGRPDSPVVAFYRSHGVGAVVDVRRIRQQNIELLATTKATIQAPLIVLDGNVTVTGTLTATEDVIGGGKSLKNHVHSGVTTGSGNTAKPV